MVNENPPQIFIGTMWMGDFQPVQWLKAPSNAGVAGFILGPGTRSHILLAMWHGQKKQIKKAKITTKNLHGKSTPHGGWDGKREADQSTEIIFLTCLRRKATETEQDRVPTDIA